MAKNLLKAITPSASRIRKIKSLHILGDWIYATNLWHLNRYSASMAFFVGLFVAFMPIPGQMVLAALLALRLRCNLPISVCLVWITNPLTVPAVFFIAYKVGALILEVPVGAMEFELSYRWLSSQLAYIWQPFLLGCLVCGVLSGCVGYFVVSMAWRWRVSVLWRERKRRRANRLANNSARH
jgi:uncharacterized protein (DUF2062 family)